MPPIPRKNELEKTPPAPSPALPAETRLDARPESANTRETPRKYNRLADVPGLREAFDRIQTEHRTDEINNLHAQIADPRNKVEKAVSVGRLLTLQKERLGHANGWTAYKKSLPFSGKTCENYIALYEHRDKIVNITNLTEAYRLVSKLRADSRNKQTQDGGEETDDTEPTLKIHAPENDSPDVEEDRAETSKKTTTERKIPPVEIHFPDDERRALFETKLRTLTEDGRWGNTEAEVLERGLYELEKHNPSRAPRLGMDLLHGPSLSRFES